MAEYDPLTNRQRFLDKWLRVTKSGRQVSADHLYQLSLDIFATRRGRNWRDCTIGLDDEEQLVHPDGRRIFITFTKTANYPLSSQVTFFPDEEAASNYDYTRGYGFDRTANGIEVSEELPEPEEVHEISLDPPTCTQLYRELLQAHLNTPWQDPPIKRKRIYHVPGMRVDDFSFIGEAMKMFEQINELKRLLD